MRGLQLHVLVLVCTVVAASAIPTKKATLPCRCPDITYAPNIGYLGGRAASADIQSRPVIVASQLRLRGGALGAGGGKRGRNDDDGGGLALTERASAAVQAAAEMARGRGNLEVTPLHLFLAMLEEGGQQSVLRLMLKQVHFSE